MKKTIKYIAWAVLALGAVSCAKDSLRPSVENEEGLTLRFFSSEMTTKAAVPGQQYENQIRRIDFFLYPVDASGNVNENIEAAFQGELVPESQSTTNTYSTIIRPEKLAEIFPGTNKKAKIFAVANYFPTVIEDGKETAVPLEERFTSTKLADLKALKVGNTFTDGNQWPHPLATTDESLYFVMTGEQDVNLNISDNTAATATVPLARIASKVTVNFTYENVVDARDASITWVPQKDGAETRVYLSNAFVRATLGGPMPEGYSYVKDSKETWKDHTRDILEYSYDYMTDLAAAEKEPTYYTYPVSLDAGDDNQPYLKLVLPWYAYRNFGTKTQEKVKQKEVYYKISLPRDALRESNRIYEYNVTVNIVGSDIEVELTGTYNIKNWTTHNPIANNVATGRYISLDIPKDTYEMYTDLTEILYVASGEVEISDLKIYQDDFSSANSTVIDFITGKNANGTYRYGTGKNASTPDYTPTGETAHTLDKWVTVDNEHLVVNHRMNNDFSDTNFDAAPMYFVVTLHLKDAGNVTTYDREVTIIQYPALYVTKDAHYGHVFVNEYSGISGTISAWDNRGTQTTYTDYYYGVEGSVYEPYFLGNIISINSSMDGTGTNNNPNNYTVYVSSLSGNTKGWLISDPRESSVTHLDYIGTSTDPLDNYHKTREDADLIIAPAFKIASSYGKCANANVLYDNAVERCASYQENGYPAGRWRVPTQAEIEFTVNLSRYNKIPNLFDASYWASNRKGYNSSGGTFVEGDRYAVRCVYDIWYWGEEKSEKCYSGDDAQGNKLYNKWGGFQD